MAGIADSVRKVFRLSHSDPFEQIQPYDQDMELANLASEIQAEFERRVEERRPFELQWRLNQNFIAGNQYCDIFDALGAVEELDPLSNTEQRSVYNQIAPIVEIRLSKLSRVHPGPVVRPLTSDSSDVTAAKVSTRILKAVGAAQNMKKKGAILNAWAEHTGGAFIKSVWNPRLGRPLGEMDGRMIFEGDISATVVPYYEIFPSTCYEEDIQNLDSIMHVKAYTVSEIKNRWGIDIPGRDLDVYSMNVTGVVAGGGGYSNSNMSIQTQLVKDSELVIEYYEKPSDCFPQGRFAIVIAGYCVYLSTLKFRCGDNFQYGYPFSHQRCLSQPGVFWGTTVVERCIPLQRDYNANKNAINEYLARLTIGNLAVEEGSLVDPDIFENGIEPGQVIEYRSGSQPPVWMRPEEVPASLPNEINSLREEFVNVSGVSEMARTSQAPGSISSGTALEALKEQDDTRLALTADSIHDCYIEMWKQWLRLFKQFAVSRRVSRVVGDDFGDVYSFVWDRNDISSDDVTVDTMNEMVNTPAQRKQTALDLLNAGLFNDPDTGRLTREGRAKLLEIFDLGNTESIIDIDEMQTANAKRENVFALAEEPLEIMPFDNHSLHLAEHMRFALSADFRELRRSRPRAATAFLAHYDEHKQAAVQEAMDLQGAPGMVSNGSPMDAAMTANAENIGALGAGQ